MSDNFQENPGAHYKSGSIFYRGYQYSSTGKLGNDPNTFLLPEGSKVLSVYYAKWMEMDEDLIVFYTDTPEEVVKFVMRKYYSHPDRVTVLSPMIIPQVTKRTESLPSIFESPYGRMYRKDYWKNEAEKGFNRIVRSVFQFAKDGCDIRQGQLFMVEFNNGDVELGYATTYVGMGYKIQMSTILPLTAENGPKLYPEFWKAWTVNEGLIPLEEVAPEPVPTLPAPTSILNTRPMGGGPTLRERLLAAIPFWSKMKKEA